MQHIQSPGIQQEQKMDLEMDFLYIMMKVIVLAQTNIQF